MPLDEALNNQIATYREGEEADRFTETDKENNRVSEKPCYTFQQANPMKLSFLFYEPILDHGRTVTADRTAGRAGLSGG